MERTSFAPMQCSLAQTLEIVGDWWTPLILRDLFLGVDRFDELVENLAISRNLLTRRLALLVKRGLVLREPYLRRPVRNQYRLTEAGRALVPILAALTAWGDRWAPPPGGGAIGFFHSDCGRRFTPLIVCSECGEILDGAAMKGVATAVARPGPGIAVIARKLAPP